MVKKHGVMEASRRLHRGIRYDNNPAGNVRRYGKRHSVKRYSRRGFFQRFSDNPAVATITTPVKTLVSKDFLLGTVLPITGGFIGARVLGDFAGSKILKINYGTAVWHKPVFVLGAGVAGSILIGLVFKKADLGAKVLAGSAIAVLSTLIEPKIREFTKVGVGVGDLGADMTEELKEKIASSIKEEIAKTEGVGSFLTKENMPSSMGDFLTTKNVQSGISGVSLDEMMGEVF
jgi:hypothetical protein